MEDKEGNGRDQSGYIDNVTFVLRFVNTDYLVSGVCRMNSSRLTLGAMAGDLSIYQS